MTPEHIAEIAAGLTKAQANYIMCAVIPDWDDRYWINVTDAEMMRLLFRSGCGRAADWDLMIMALSDLGLAIHSHLEAEGGR